MRSHSNEWRYSVLLGVLIAVGIAVGCASHVQNPAAAALQAAPDSLANVPQIGPILLNSCFDCHGHQGSGSVTAKLAPSHLFGEAKARQAFDLSDWPALNPQEQRAMADAIVKAINSGSMPPSDYLSFHPSARLTDDQKRQLAEWAAHQGAAPAH